jgi:hypothetical protein
MTNRESRLMCLMVLGIVSTSGEATGVVWPELPKDCFVSARPATAADAKKGCAAFMIGQAGMSVGKPLEIKIPQYAWHMDRATGKRTPVILIQAEESSGIKAVGYKEIDSAGLGAALLTEMILLGSEKPKQ